jgi:hypothetical protein
VFLPVIGIAYVVVEPTVGDDEPVVGITSRLLIPATGDESAVEFVLSQITPFDPNVFEAALALVGGVTAHEDAAAGWGPMRSRSRSG